jgi:hypothetical protein
MLVSSEKLLSLAVLTQGGLRFDVERRSINGTTLELTLNLRSQQELTTRPICLGIDEEAGAVSNDLCQRGVREAAQSCQLQAFKIPQVGESFQ